MLDSMHEFSMVSSITSSKRDIVSRDDIVGGSGHTKLSHIINFVSIQIAPSLKMSDLRDVYGSLPFVSATQGHFLMVISPRYLNKMIDVK
jgi:hypothetical protein